MSKMQSCFWSEPRTKPTEDSPPVEPQSTGGGTLTFTSTQVGHSDQRRTEPPPDVPGQSLFKGNGVKPAAERNVSTRDEGLQKRPLQVKRRNRRQRARKPVVKEDDSDEETDPDKETVQIHGLSVQRYREVYHSVLTPAALSALPTNDPAEYMAQVLELKQMLWAALYRPQFKETVGEDGRVQYTETYDLT